MSIISTTALQHVLDKLARFATESVGDPEFSSGFNAGMDLAWNDVLTGTNSIATYLLTVNDLDVEADLLPPARTLYQNEPTPPAGFLLNIKSVNAMVAALDTHVKVTGGYANLNAYLTALNAGSPSAPTLRAHAHFAKYLKTLSPGNVFIANDLAIASFAETGAATGTRTALASVDKTKYGGAQLKIKNVGALTTSAVVSVTAKKVDGSTEVLTATLSTHTDAAETALSDTGKLFVDVTAIAITVGTSGDHFDVIAKTDRSIASA